MPSPDPTVCPLCQRPNRCGMVEGKDTCWCSGVVMPQEILDRIPENARGVACICRECATGEREQTVSEP